MTVIQHLQKDIEHIRMRFLDLIKEDHGIGIPADLFTELAALLIPYISWRRTDQLGNAVLLHVLRHINPDHGLFTAEDYFSQCLGKLRFSNTGRTQK